jgi:hypothetical protein
LGSRERGAESRGSAFALRVYGVTRGRFGEGGVRCGGPCEGSKVGRWEGGGVTVQACCLFLEDGPGAVGGAVVDHDDFVRDAAEFQLEVKVLDGGGDAAFFVAGGDDDRE